MRDLHIVLRMLHQEGTYSTSVLFSKQPGGWAWLVYVMWGVSGFHVGAVGLSRGCQGVADASDCYCCPEQSDLADSLLVYRV
jgi:hypothetical protein